MPIIAIAVGILLTIGACTSTSETSTSSGDTSSTSLSPTTIVSGSSTTGPTSPGTTSITPSTTSSTSSTVPLGELVLELREIGSDFEAPVFLAADPDGGSDLIVEQSGRVVRVDDGSVVLDIRDDVRWRGEQGLLGLAFHPDFLNNRLAYANYTNNRGQTVIEQFAVLGDTFDLVSRKVILRVDQPAANHNGGMIAFGPHGHLWIGMGDGGASNDRFRNGQNPESLLGAMLRISVPGSEDAPYDIPESNPFPEGSDGAREVYAVGLRNPWRFSFDLSADGASADLWIADVGQGSFEEIHLVSSSERPVNYGWPIIEGSSCFRSNDCDQTGLAMPIIEYGHDEGCSVTGGYVYRGSEIPELDGHYFYSDYCTGFLRSYSVVSGHADWSDQVGTIGNVSSFGIGGDGEMYIIAHDGSVFRLERSG